MSIISLDIDWFLSPSALHWSVTQGIGGGGEDVKEQFRSKVESPQNDTWSCYDKNYWPMVKPSG